MAVPFDKRLRTIIKGLEVFVFKRARPVSVEFAITDKCNLNCAYCVPVYTAKTRPREDYLSTAQISKIFYHLSRMGVIRLNLSGGEPLLHSDIARIIETALACKFNLSLTTNGILIPSYLELLSGVDLLIISIDGLKVTYDLLRGENTHSQVLKSIDLAYQKGIKIMLSTVVTNKTSAEDLFFVLDLCKQYNISCVFQPVGDRVYRNDVCDLLPKAQALIPSVSQIDSIVESLQGSPLRKRIINFNGFFMRLLGNYKIRQNDPLQIKPCAAGKLFFHISPFGEFFPCSMRSYDLPAREIENFLYHGIEYFNLKPVKCIGCHCYSYMLMSNLFYSNLLNF